MEEKKESESSPENNKTDISNKENEEKDNLEKKNSNDTNKTPNKKEKEKENNSQKDTEVPSDYAPPPKHDEIKNLNIYQL